MKLVGPKKRLTALGINAWLAILATQPLDENGRTALELLREDIDRLLSDQEDS